MTQGNMLEMAEKDAFIFPASFAQQRLWFLHQLEPESPVYNMRSAFRLRGSLNVAALERSFNEIVRRHEALRTTFLVRDGAPVQIIAPALTIGLGVVDLCGLGKPASEAEVSRLCAEEAQRPFDLAQGPLLRATLLRVGNDEHVLVSTVHHIVCDGWSMQILFRELTALYDAFCTDRPSPLATLPIQYADFSVWQREWLQGERFNEQLSYWKNQLKGMPAALDLPTDGNRPQFQTFCGGHESLLLSRSLSEAIKKLCREESATLFMTLLAVFKILLCRYSGQDDIAVGAPVAGRNRAEIESLIGFFINTLVLRTDMSGNPTFRELLVRVRKMALDAYAYQDLPFEKLVEELQPKRDLSRTPLFQVFFNTINLEASEFELSGLRTEPLGVSAANSKFDLTLYVIEQDQEIRLDLVYNTDLFCRERMVELLQQFKQLLSQIVRNPDERINRFSLVTTTAKKILPNPAQSLPHKWKASVHARLSEQSQRTPTRVALSDTNAAWTYKELNCRSNQLANCLTSKGIRPHDVVAIYGRRSASLVWALLGILKAGAAFVILDSAYPTSRVIERLRVAKPKGWLHDEAAGPLSDEVRQFLEASSCHWQLALPSFSTHSTSFKDYSMDDPDVRVGPDDLAYLAFTSGTNGTPKAIEGTHSPLSHFFEWHCETFKFHQSDRFSMLSGVSHDPLLRDIFTPLWLGATLCVPDLENMSPAGLATWMKQNGITVAHLTPAMSEFLTEGARAVQCVSNSLRYVFFCGDVLTESHVNRIKQFAAGATCVNFYGATETPQAMGYFVIPEQHDHPGAVGSNARRIVPLGRGIDGVQLLVLNRMGQLAGVGELGEIHVRTPYLAKGYSGDEALTQDRFIVNAFTGASGDRLYRSGDLGRYLPDGGAEFAGRSDHQVKIRGFRIELGEIETILYRYPGVRKTVVVARDDEPGNRRLVAYIVPNHKPAPNTNDLRSFLKQNLPDAMVPSAFVFLDALPLTANGKIDRRALPPPETNRSDLRVPFVAPQDALELQLTKLWEKILGVKPIGITDDFFDLGGHSLLAVRLFAKTEELTGKKLPLVTLFQAPTIEQQASLIREKNWSAPWNSLVAIQAGGSKPPFFCVHAHEGNVLFYRDLARHLGPDQPFYGLQAQGLDGKQAPLNRLEDMAAHYVKEIRTVQPDGPYFFGGYCFGGLVAFEMARQLYAAGEKVALVAVIDTYAPGYLRSFPNSTSRFETLYRHLKKLAVHFDNLSILGPEEKLRYIRGRLVYMAHRLSTGTGLPSLRTRARIAILKSMTEASRKYTPDLYPGQVTLLRASHMPAGRSHDSQLGWGKLAGGGVEVRLVPGYFAHTVLEPRVRKLAEQLAACLNQAQSTESCARISGRRSQPATAINHLAMQAAP